MLHIWYPDGDDRAAREKKLRRQVLLLVPVMVLAMAMVFIARGWTIALAAGFEGWACWASWATVRELEAVRRPGPGG